MKIETAEIFSIEECLANPNKLYVFGENKEQQGSSVMGGGQAVIRGVDNSFGFCTLSSIGDHWRDDRFNDNRVQIETDIFNLQKKAEKYEVIVFPKFGLGTGRARMQAHCPQTFLYLCRRLLEQFSFNNMRFLKPPNF